MPSSSTSSHPSSAADTAPAPSSPRPGGTRPMPRGAIAAPLLFTLVVSLCLGGAVLSASSPRAMQAAGAVIDRLLEETIEDWLDIDTFAPLGLRPTDHPVTRWMLDAMRPEHPELIRPEADARGPEAGFRGPSGAEADAENGDADGAIAADRGPGHITATGSGGVAVW